MHGQHAGLITPRPYDRRGLQDDDHIQGAVATSTSMKREPAQTDSVQTRLSVTCRRRGHGK